MLGLAAVALGFTLLFFDYAPLAQRPVLLFGFVFLIDLGVAALAWLDEKTSAAQPVAGLAVFGLLAVWTDGFLTNGLLNAALFTASILPLSTAYYVCEAFGFERGVDRRFGDAKIFYGLYLAFILIGAGVVIVPNAPLLGIIFYSQVLNGALLPVVLVLMLLLINNKRIMGRWTNGLGFNVIAWATVVIVSILTVISTIQIVFPQIGS